MRRRRPLSSVAVAAALMGTLVLAGCTSPEAPSTAPPSASVAPEASPSPSVSEAPAAPALQPEGTAADNLPFFTTVVQQVWTGPEPVSSRAYVDALTAAGFAREAMQVTTDTSTVGNPAESLQFSVRWGEKECLVGQVGPSTGEPVTTVMSQLAEGRCLVGETLPIDW